MAGGRTESPRAAMCWSLVDGQALLQSLRKSRRQLTERFSTSQVVGELANLSNRETLQHARESGRKLGCPQLRGLAGGRAQEETGALRGSWGECKMALSHGRAVGRFLLELNAQSSHGPEITQRSADTPARKPAHRCLEQRDARLPKLGGHRGARQQVHS